MHYNDCVEAVKVLLKRDRLILVLGMGNTSGQTGIAEGNRRGGESNKLERALRNTRRYQTVIISIRVVISPNRFSKMERKSSYPKNKNADAIKAEKGSSPDILNLAFLPRQPLPSIIAAFSV